MRPIDHQAYLSHRDNIKNYRDRGIRSRAIPCNNLDTISSTDLAQKLELPSITQKNTFSR